MVGLVIMLIHAVAKAFRYSFFFTVASAIYLLLRHDVDQKEMDEVWLATPPGPVRVLEVQHTRAEGKPPLLAQLAASRHAQSLKAGQQFPPWLEEFAEIVNGLVTAIRASLDSQETRSSPVETPVALLAGALRVGAGRRELPCRSHPWQ